jgi:hypothetical protein
MLLGGKGENFLPLYQMNNDYIQEDIRVINLYSQSATQYLNGTLKSNVNFNFKNILRDQPDIIYSTIGIVNAQIPVSYYTINEYNDILTTGLGNISITRGNYNASSLRTELATLLIAVGITGMVVTINSSTGRLTFTASIPFTFLSSSSFDTLGFEDTTYTSVGNVINAPYLLNLLGIQQLRINSSALACSNSNSTTMGESNLIGVVQSTAPPFGMILYSNQTSYSVLKSKTVSLLDIQILDENGNYVDFNNVDWTISLQLTTFRRIPLPSNSTDYLRPILATLNTIQSDLENNPPASQQPADNTQQPDDPAQDLLTQENQDQANLFSDDSNSLDIMSYNKTLPS